MRLVDLRASEASSVHLLPVEEGAQSSRGQRKIVDSLEKKGVRILSFYDAL